MIQLAWTEHLNVDCQRCRWCAATSKRCHQALRSSNRLAESAWWACPAILTRWKCWYGKCAARTCRYQEDPRHFVTTRAEKLWIKDMARLDVVLASVCRLVLTASFDKVISHHAVAWRLLECAIVIIGVGCMAESIHATRVLTSLWQVVHCHETRSIPERDW